MPAAMNRKASLIVEVFAVLFLVGLLAVVAIPDSEQPPGPSPQRALIISLEEVRAAMGRYWADHDARYPSFEEVCDISRSQPTGGRRHGLGAYLVRIPANPFTGGRTVQPITSPAGSSDWVYDAPSGVFKANDSVESRGL
jgi:hypothetical protein